MQNNIKWNNADTYIKSFPKKIQPKLQQLRSIIKSVAKNSEEIISYNMPAYKMNKVLVYFAGYKNHIGFYPSSSGVRVFQNLLNDFKTSKGAIQFPLDHPLPVMIIKKIVKFRLLEDKERALAKEKMKTKKKSSNKK